MTQPVPTHLLRSPTVASLLPRALPTRETALLLVVAPAGFGKSSFLALWAAQAPTAWLTLIPADNEPERLLSGLSAALGLPVDSTCAAVLAALSGGRLVLDDLQEVSSEESLALLDQVVAMAPASVLALGSRREPPLPALQRARVRRQVTTIGVDQLAFRGKDLERLTREVLGMDLSANACALLEAKTDGWAAAIVLAGQSLAMLPPPQQEAALTTLAEGASLLYDYLAAEVLAGLPPALRQFSLEQCLVPCLRYQPETEATLRELARRHLVIPVAGGYVFHQLFATFLRARLREEWGEAAVIAHADRLAAALWERGFDEDALTVWEESGLSATIAAHLAERLAGGAEPLTYRRWIRALPDAVLHDWPALLCIAGAWHGDAHHFALAEQWLLAAEARFRAEGDTEGTAEAILRRVRVLRYQNRWDDVGALLDTLLREPPTRTTWQIYLHQECAFWQLFHRQDFAAAAAALGQVQHLLPRAELPKTLQASILVQNATMRDRWRGAFPQIRQAADQLEQLFGAALTPVHAAFAACLRAEAAYQEDDPEALPLFTTFAQAAATAESVGLSRAARSYLAVFYARQGEREQALPLCNELPGSGDMACFAPLARAWLAAHRNDRVAVRAAADETRAFPLHSVEAAERWRFAAPLLHVGDTEGAALFAALGADAAEHAALPFDHALAQLWQSALVPEPQRITACLEAIVAQGWYQSALRQSILPMVLGHALVAGLAPDATATLSAALGMPLLTVHGFGGLRVQRNGKEVEWPRPKARALFAYLWLADGAFVPIDPLIEALWPGATLTNGRQSYRTHCSYLRQVLGDGCLETAADSLRLVLPATRYDERRLLLQAHASAALALARVALERVGTAEFLPEFAYEDWSQEGRDTLCRTRQELRLRLAEHALAHQNPEQALPLARAAVAEDGSDEDAALTLIAALVAAGHPGEARKVWRRLVENLAELLLLPTPSALAVARKLGLTA